MALHELVYVSLADHPMSRAELSALLECAREHNRQHGITGLLICSEREFMQLLEGEREEVFTLYRHIERDPRHTQVHMIWDGPIPSRSCEHWAMGYMAAEDAALHALPDGHRVQEEGLFAAGRSSAGKRIFLHLRKEFLTQTDT